MTMYRVVEVYDDSVAMAVGQETLPGSCLVEDEDGIRIFVSAFPSFLASLWVRAHSQGCAAILIPADPWRFITTEGFAEQRIEHAATATYEIALDACSHSAEPLTYRQMLQWGDHLREEAARTSLDGEFVHLHTHSEFSALDAVSKMDEIVREVVADNQPALAITDHGVCGVHPLLQDVATKAGIKPIFGLEANFCDDRFLRGDPEIKDHARTVLGDYRHLILWAMNDTGLRNLWAMSTEANREGFYGRPRMDWSTLERYHEGVMASTACLRGPVNAWLRVGNEERARADLARLLAIFGDGLYAELHTNDLVDQIKVNHQLVALAREFSIPLIAAVDSHYPCYADKDTHRAWIAVQTNKDLHDEKDLFDSDADYHLLTAREVRQSLAYLGDDVVKEAMGNTLGVADRCNAQIRGRSTTPIFSRKGNSDAERIRADVDRLVDLCMANWSKTLDKRDDQETYLARFEREMHLLISKGFCGYFLMVADYCLWAKEHGILVGPGRGSGGGCLVAYLAGITEIDPVEADLIFERFLTEGRTALPDFDVDFPTSKRPEMTEYVMERWGKASVVRVGTHLRVHSKGVVRDLARALKSVVTVEYRDLDAFSKIVDEAERGEAGLGLSWEDLWVQHGDVLEPFRAKYPVIFDLAGKMVGRLKSYGRHAAGYVIATDGVLTDQLPMRMAGDENDRQLVTDFDMDALEKLGLVKFDLLTLRTLDTIQVCVDLIAAERGDKINPYAWREEYRDPMVWDAISDGETLGIFQIETRGGTKLTKRFRPQSLSDLSDVITLVRPGPQRSGLTDQYFRRRAGMEPVTLPDPRLEPVLAKTFGCIVYQEDVMRTCMVLGGYDENEADTVRRILGKKKVEAVAKEGEKFVSRCVERGMEYGAAETLWSQMAEFAKYSFNRAHAWGYAVIGYWTAWLKFHYPQQFLTAALSTVDDDRVPEFINEARRQGYRVLPPDVNISGPGFAREDGLTIRFGLTAIKGVGDKAAAPILAKRPFDSLEGFLEAMKGTPCDAGVVKLLARVGALDSLVPNRRALERRLEWSTSDESGRCQNKDETVVAAHGLPCRFDWASEPVELTPKGKPRKPKPPPKRCTKGCRQYVAPSEPDFDAEVPLADSEVREREMELLGVYVSSTPFDVIHPSDLEQCSDADEVENGPPGEYMIAALIQRVKPHTTRTGKKMGFATLFAMTGEIDVTVFTEAWSKYRDALVPDRLCLAMIRKNSRGYELRLLHPL